VELKGRVAVVTGGAVRLGRAIAIALAESGANIVLHYGSSAADAADTKRELEARGARVETVQANLSHPAAAAEQIFARVKQSFGVADVLVNSAAIFEPDDLSTIDDEHWDRHFNINLKSPVFSCQAFARQLPGDRRGHVINIADWRALRPATGHLAYTLTKAGIVALTKELALELAPRIQVNAIAPGAILPPPGQGAEYLERLAKQVPLRRVGSPKDVTDTVLFLLRSDFMTGEVVHVTGGEEL